MLELAEVRKRGGRVGAKGPTVVTVETMDVGGSHVGR